MLFTTVLQRVNVLNPGQLQAFDNNTMVV